MLYDRMKSVDTGTDLSNDIHYVDDDEASYQAERNVWSSNTYFYM